MDCFNSAFSRAWDTCRLWLVGYSWYLPGVGAFVDCSGFGFDFAGTDCVGFGVWRVGCFVCF